MWATVGEPARAVRLFGAECARRPGRLVIRPGERYEEDLAHGRRALGSAAFLATWSEGQAMSLDEAVAYALAEAPAADARGTARRSPGALSPPERRRPGRRGARWGHSAAG